MNPPLPVNNGTWLKIIPKAWRITMGSCNNGSDAVPSDGGLMGKPEGVVELLLT